MKSGYWRIIPLFLFVLLIIFFWRGLSLEPRKLPSVQVGKTLASFELPCLDREKLFNSNELQGRVALLNVWASWCATCSEEQLFLLKLRERLPIYGLNYKDDSEQARQWLKDWGNPYQAVAEDKQGRVAMDLGVYGTPETFLIDKKGIIRYRHTGILNEALWEKNFLPLLKKLEGEP